MPNSSFRTHTLTVKDLQVKVYRKQVKNLNLRVYPSKQEIRLSIPWHASLDIAQQFISKKYPWIKQKLEQTRKHSSEAEKKFVNGETHHYMGQALELLIKPGNKSMQVSLDKKNAILHLCVPPGSTAAKREKALSDWYRAELKSRIPKLIEKWEPDMGVSVQEFGVKMMKTRWGSCNIRDRRIWLNLELAKKSPQLLEYVVVHEMIHLLERLHSKRFYQLMEQFIPDWKEREVALNGRFRIRNC